MNIRSSFVATLHFVVVTLCAGCGSTFPMVPDAQVPFAKGEVDAAFADAGNGKMSLKVEHLGDPAKLKPGAKTYVVWVRPLGKEDAKTQNVGVLDMDDDYSGQLEFTTPYRSFEVTVSPEENAEVTAPTGRDVLKTTVSAD